MSTQLDIFGGGETHSFPPHCDPAKVVACRVRRDVDRDFVGRNEVGMVGNNAEVFVFEVLGIHDVVLYAESFSNPTAAEEQVEHHEAMLEVHRQKELWG